MVKDRNIKSQTLVRKLQDCKNFLLLSTIITAQKMKFSIKDLICKYGQNLQEIAGVVTFTEEIVNGKLHFFAVGGTTASVLSFAS